MSKRDARAFIEDMLARIDLPKLKPQLESILATMLDSDEATNSDD